MKTIYIFVYGTLKQGFPNYHIMDGKVKFISNGKTKNKYNLVVGGEYNVPFLFLPQNESCGHCIYGEIYEVDSSMMEILDKFEGCPNYYYRKLISVNRLDENTNVECFVYIKKDIKDLLELPTMENYDLDPDYIPPNKRPKQWKDRYLKY